MLLQTIISGNEVAAHIKQSPGKEPMRETSSNLNCISTNEAKHVGICKYIVKMNDLMNYIE